MPFFQGSLAELQEAAEVSQRPYLLYFYQDQSKACKKMSKKTWQDPDLMHFLEHQVLTLPINALASGGQVEQVTSYEVYTFPTLLVFHPNGELSGKIEGFVAASTLQSILSQHLLDLSNKVPQTKPLLALSPFLFESTQPQQEVAHADGPAKPLFAYQTTSALQAEEEVTTIPAKPSLATRAIREAGMVSRGETSSTLHIDVPGMGDYSLKQLDLTPEAPQKHGLLIGAYTSFQQLQDKVGRFQKIWKDTMWVYCEEIEETPVYKLVLGDYSTREEAEIFAQAIYKIEKTPTTILELSRLLP
ncbi:MAG: thioredoxin family protein [Bacteroidota bacterium]